MPPSRRLKILLFLLLLSAFIYAEKPRYIYDPQPTKAQKVQDDLFDLETALDAFDYDIGRYPTTSENLNALVTNPNLPNWKGPYLQKLPNDPWGDPYLYHPTYALSSNGPDHQPHTDDDIIPQ